MVHRLKLLATTKEYSMEYEGTNICVLKGADLKKAASRQGVAPIGNADEILTELVEVLKKKGKPTASSSTSASASTEASSTSQGCKL